MDRLLTAMSTHYDEIYDMAQAILDRHSPCGLAVNRDGQASCRKYDTDYFGGQVCCSDCKYHEFGVGCTVKALGCKMSLDCGLIPHNHPAEIEMDALRDKVAFYGIIGSHFRVSKETTMKQLAARKRCKFDKQNFCIHSSIPGLTPKGFLALYKLCCPTAKYACDNRNQEFIDTCARDCARQMDRLRFTPKAAGLYFGENSQEAREGAL